MTTAILIAVGILAASYAYCWALGSASRLGGPTQRSLLKHSVGCECRNGRLDEKCITLTRLYSQQKKKAGRQPGLVTDKPINPERS